MAVHLATFDRTGIRRIEGTDLAAISAFAYSVSVAEPHDDLARLREMYAANALWGDDAGAVALVDLDSAHMVGTLQFFRSGPCIHGLEIGYVVHAPDDRGQGHAARGLRLLSDLLFDQRPQFYRHQLLIGVWNTPSWKVAERCGFLREGVLRSSGFGDGDPGDSLIYSRTRKDFDRADRL